jgi:hypothetical protein
MKKIACLRIFTALLLALILVACGSDSDQSDNNDDESASSGTPRHGLRVLHAADSVGGLDFFINGQRVGSNVAYPEASAYMDSFEDEDFLGDITLEVYAHLEDEEDHEDSEPLLLQELTLDENSRLTAIVHELGDDIDISVVSEEADNLDTRIRFSHFISDVDAIDLYISHDAGPDSGSVSPLVSGMAPGDVSDYVEVDPEESLRLWVTPAGGDDILFDTGEANENGSLFLRNQDHVHLALLSMAADRFVNSRGFSKIGGQGLIASNERSTAVAAVGDARVRYHVLQASPDAPVLDVSMDGDIVAEGLDYRDVAESIMTIAGTRHFELFDADGNSVSGVAEDINFARAGDYMVVAMGSDEAGEMRVIRNLISQGPLNFEEGERAYRVRAVNAYYAYPSNIDLVVNDAYVVGGTDLAYGQTFAGGRSYDETEDGDYVAYYEAGTYGISDVELARQETSFETGRIYTAILAGIYSDAEDPDLIFIENIHRED